jgi:hypothetical protein
MVNELVKKVKSSSIVVTFKIKFKSSGTVGQSIEGIINPTTGMIKCQTTEEIIKNGKRFNKKGILLKN